MNLDIEKLEALAKAALAERYRNQELGASFPSTIHARALEIAANPAAVLELIADIQRLQSDNQSLRGSCAAMGKDRMSYVRGQSKAMKEREQIKAENEALRKDAERLDRLDMECEGYGFEVHEGNRWVLDGPFNSARDAIDALIELKS